jgi:hypothetical protein
MQKPPVGFRGDTGTGALIGISAVGLQDTFLYSNDKAPTEHEHIEYTQGTPFYRVYKPTQTAFLGQEIRHTFYPKEMGDLLRAMLISFNLPTTSDSGKKSLINVGYNMISKIRLLVDGSEIQNMTGEFMSHYESMFSTQTSRVNTLNLMANLNYAYNTQSAFYRNSMNQRIVLPIPFFFNTHYEDGKVNTNSFRSAFPLCAMFNSEITLVIQFKTLEEIAENTSNFTTTDLTDFKFITREIVLTNAERNDLKFRRLDIPIEKFNTENFKIELDRSAPTTKYRYYFNSAYSCRAILWDFKELVDGFNPTFFAPIKTATINTLKKTDRSEERVGLFYQDFQAYAHNYYNGGTFYGYAFSENPLDVVRGDYEYRAPRPQSSYIDMVLQIAAAGYVLWSFGDKLPSYTVSENYILTRDIGGDPATDTLSITNASLRTNTSNVGISSYSDTGINTELPHYVRLATSIDIDSQSTMNINTFVSQPAGYKISFYYLSTVFLVIQNGKASIFDQVSGFGAIDTDKSGYIDASELKAFDDNIDLAVYDNDKDGLLSYGEFMGI